ncbi:MAG TPA: WYL domain-containing protein [Acidimicrobiales bacterium]|nr:WYL domain-containing protein [Acidimicrobiales bacterium]
MAPDAGGRRVTPRLPAGPRLRRLLAILAWVAPRGRVRIDDIAARFGMTPDEVVTELEMAACCGLPPYTPDQLIEVLIDGDEVEADLGPQFSRPVRFSAAEGFTVAAAARALRAVPGSDPDGALASALAKLEAALGDRARQVSVDLDEPPLLDRVRRAAAGGRSIDIDYYSASRDELTARRVDPYGVFSTGGRWYLAARCHRAGGVRNFRVDRIEAVSDTAEAFDHPDWSAPEEVFEPGPDTPVAELLVPAEATWLIESVPSEVVGTEADGRVRARLAVGGEAWLARLILQAGPGTEVVEPEELRQLGRDTARSVLSRYG